MRALPAGLEAGHEGADARLGLRSRIAAALEIVDEARIARREPAELSSADSRGGSRTSRWIGSAWRLLMFLDLFQRAKFQLVNRKKSSLGPSRWNRTNGGCASGSWPRRGASAPIWRRCRGLIGRNSAYLNQYVKRASPRALEERDRLKLARFLGIGESELRAGDGYDRPAPSRADTVDVPRLPLDASAGPGAFAAEEISYDTHRLSRRWLREMGLEGAKLSAIRVEGDSMVRCSIRATRSSSIATSAAGRGCSSSAWARRYTSSASSVGRTGA